MTTPPAPLVDPSTTTGDSSIALNVKPNGMAVPPNQPPMIKPSGDSSDSGSSASSVGSLTEASPTLPDKDTTIDLATPLQINEASFVDQKKAEEEAQKESADAGITVATEGAAPITVVSDASEAKVDESSTQALLNQLTGVPAPAPTSAPSSVTPPPSLDPSLAAPTTPPSSTSSIETMSAAEISASDSNSALPPTPVDPALNTPLPLTTAQNEANAASQTGSLPSSVLEVLVKNNALPQETADQLMVEEIRSGKSVEQLIQDRQLVNEEVLSQAKAEVFGVPFVRISDIGISPEALTILPESVARRYNMLPFALDKNEKTLSVVMKEPLDLTAIDFAEQKTGLRLIVHYAMPSELERTVAERYAQSLSTEVTQALQETTQVADQKKQQQDLSNLSGEVVRQAPITKIVETILAFAIKARASDVHIEPLLDRTRVRYRIDGLLTEKLILPKSVHEATVSRIKILSDLKIDEKRVPQDGRFNFVAEGQEVDLRVSTLPTIHGEKIVMRLLKKNATVPSLPELGLRGFALRSLEDSIRVPHGIILVTGPTGSGKTTTLYSVLHLINTPKVNIVTLEDPVEYQMGGINQVQINPQAGLSFASGLRSFLRQDPNIIMVGEIRDSETVELAIQASLTGHLVFSTLHTSSASGALPRLMDMGAEPFLLASSMTLTMAQRIVRCLHPDYKEEYKPEQAVVDDFKKVLGERFEMWCKQHAKDPNNITLYRSKADRPQTEPEYKGRMGIFEVMKITEEISKMIMERKSAAEIEKVAIRDGMLLMKQDGYLKALEGITTIEEVLRVAQV
jgi:type IV pilus assembly protein PilB